MLYSNVNVESQSPVLNMADNPEYGTLMVQEAFFLEHVVLDPCLIF